MWNVYSFFLFLDFSAGTSGGIYLLCQLKFHVGDSDLSLTWMVRWHVNHPNVSRTAPQLVIMCGFPSSDEVQIKIFLNFFIWSRSK